MNDFKRRGEEAYPQKIYASQLVTIDDLQELIHQVHFYQQHIFFEFV